MNPMKTNKNVILILCFIFLISCSKKPQDSGVIKADISELTKDFDAVVVKMMGVEFRGDSLQTSDTVPAREGKFEYHFKLKQPKQAYITLLKNKKLVAALSFKDKYSKKDLLLGDIFIGNENIEFIGTKDKYKISEGQGINYFTVDIEGSDEADMFVRTFTGFAASAENIKANPDSFALFNKFFDSRERYSVKHLRELSSLFSDEIKKSVSYTILQNYIKTKENLAQFGYQKNFNWLDISHKSYSFEEVQNGKLVLLVFWASWCKPCRQEIPAIKEFYNQYKDKVSIVSLSIDDKYDNWKTAVDKEQMPWLNLSGLPRSNNAVKKAYNILAVPNMILIDKNGNTLLNVVNDLPQVVEIVNKQ